MTLFNLIRAEVRKLTSTRMPLAFLSVLAVIAAANAAAVAFGTDMDGSQGFISTAADQQSLIAFAANALMIAGLFGAVAVAREYGYSTVVPTFLATPRRARAMLAQFTATSFGGAILGLAGAAMTAGAVMLALTTTDYGFLVSAGDLVRVVGASMLAGAAGAVLGAGIGAVIRNTGGAVAGAVVALLIAPPLAVQLANGAASWVPNTLANVLSGVGQEVEVVAAIGALAIWAMIPAAVGLISVVRRDVV